MKPIFLLMHFILPAWEIPWLLHITEKGWNYLDSWPGRRGNWMNYHCLVRKINSLWNDPQGSGEVPGAWAGKNTWKCGWLEMARKQLCPQTSSLPILGAQGDQKEMHINVDYLESWQMEPLTHLERPAGKWNFFAWVIGRCNKPRETLHTHKHTHP